MCWSFTSSLYVIRKENLNKTLEHSIVKERNSSHKHNLIINGMMIQNHVADVAGEYLKHVLDAAREEGKVTEDKYIKKLKDADVRFSKLQLKIMH